MVVDQVSRRRTTAGGTARYYKNYRTHFFLRDGFASCNRLLYIPEDAISITLS